MFWKSYMFWKSKSGIDSILPSYYVSQYLGLKCLRVFIYSVVNINSVISIFFLLLLTIHPHFSRFIYFFVLFVLILLYLHFFSIDHHMCHLNFVQLFEHFMVIIFHFLIFTCWEKNFNYAKYGKMPESNRNSNLAI